MDASNASNGARPESGQGIADGIDRLNRALDLLEQAVDIRLEREAELGDAEAEVQRMSADRSRLAEALGRLGGNAHSGSKTPIARFRAAWSTRWRRSAPCWTARWRKAHERRF